MIDTAEYDAFGPWITPVTDPELVPRLFRDYPLDFSRIELALKVPRDIERRHATAEMDLYDALIVLTADSLTLLLRTGGHYRAQQLPLAQVWAVRDSSHLLDARLEFFTAAGKVELAYNGAGQEGADRLVERLRELRAAAVRAHPTPESASLVPDIESVLDPVRDYGLVGTYRALARRNPGVGFDRIGYLPPVVTALAAHPTLIADRRTRHRGLPSWRRRLFLQGAIYLQSGTDIEVIGRRFAVVRGDRTNLTHSRTVVFPDSVLSVELHPHPTLALDVLVVGGEAGVSFLVPQSWSASERLIAALQLWR